MNKRQLIERVNYLRDKIINIIDMSNKTFTKLLHLNIEYTLKGGTIGKAYYSRNLLRFNTFYFHFYPEIIDNTIIHELLHIVNYYKNNNRGHGASWKRLMIKMNTSPSRTEKLEITDPRTYKYIYECGCKKWQFSTIKHNRQQHDSIYYCPHCGKDMKLYKKVNFMMTKKEFKKLKKTLKVK